MDRTRKPSSFAGMGIAPASIGFAVVVLATGAADRWAIAIVLLVGVPLLIAMGGASDQAWRALSQQRADASAAPPSGVRRASTMLGRIITGASGVIHLVVAVLLARLAISAWGNGDVALVLVALPLAAFAVWRAVSLLRRVIGQGSDPGSDRDRK